jgi:hypothetical protein
MELFTRIATPKSNIQIDYTKKIAFFGSCFADNISAQFASKKFNVFANPFGTVYNPLSIERQLQHIAGRKVFGEGDFFKDERCDGLWHCWDAHSSLSAPTSEECLEKLNAATKHARAFLQEADIVFITLGSAYIYSLKENECSRIVANCHRQDPKIFERRLISVEEAAQAIQRTATLLRDINRDIHIVFTVSPIRHIGDGAHGNNLSKATVLLGIEKALQEIAPSAEYFPSYEIVMDELRDYRFYDRDMIHLSKTAEEIIFERMLETYCDGTTRENIAKVEKFLKMASHRIQDENSPATQEFKKKLIAQANELEKHIPGLILSE